MEIGQFINLPSPTYPPSPKFACVPDNSPFQAFYFKTLFHSLAMRREPKYLIFISSPPPTVLGRIFPNPKARDFYDKLFIERMQF